MLLLLFGFVLLVLFVAAGVVSVLFVSLLLRLVCCVFVVGLSCRCAFCFAWLLCVRVSRLRVGLHCLCFVLMWLVVCVGGVCVVCVCCAFVVLLVHRGVLCVCLRCYVLCSVMDYSVFFFVLDYCYCLCAVLVFVCCDWFVGVFVFVFGLVWFGCLCLLCCCCLLRLCVFRCCFLFVVEIVLL